MKILFIIPELGYGGAETVLLRLADRLSHNHQVFIAVFRSSYQQGNYTHAPLPTSLPIVELDRSGKAPTQWLPPRLARWWRRIRELRRLKQRCDVAISFLSGANLLNALVREKTICVLTEHGSKRHDQSGNRLSHSIWCSLLDPLAYRRADRVVSVSDGLAGELLRSFSPQQQHKLLTIAGYLDPEQALSAREAPIEPELLKLAERPLLVSIGRLHPQKGFHYLLPLIAQVVHQVPDSGLLLIGDGPQEGDLVHLAESLGLSISQNNADTPFDPSAQVIFLGYRSQPARYTKLGRAFVMPSLWEGLPTVLCEALAAGSWCLAADCPWGPSEILTEPELGRLLPPIQAISNRQFWIDALTEVLQANPPRNLSLTNSQRLVGRFSIQRSALRWEALLEELIG